MTFVRPPQVTEREVSHLWVDERSMDDAKWEDCGPCTALECVIASGHAAPPTHFEEETLRMVSGYGPLGATDVPKLSAGIKARYGVIVSQVGSLAQLRTALTPGHCAFAIVKPSALPSTHVLRKYVGTGFVSLHFIYLANEGAAAPWTLDPAAPAGYTGNALSWADLAKCYVGGAGILPLAEVNDMAQKAITDMTPKLIDWPDGTPYFDVDGMTRLGVASARVGQFSPHGCGTQRAFYAGAAPSAKVALVTPSAVHPVPASLTQADVDAARAAGYSAAKTKAASAVQAI